MPETICKTIIMRSHETACREAADRFLCQALSSVSRHDFFSAALPGGITPICLLRELASDEYSSLMPWSKMHIFQTDEKHVPHTHVDSNFRVLNSELLDKIPLPKQNMHCFPVFKNHNKAAADYQDEMIQVLGDPPCLDLAVLGVGMDGHTASIFSVSDTHAIPTKYAEACWIESINALRLTLTRAALNLAQKKIFLVTGKHKAEIVSDCIGTSEASVLLPARQITLDSHDVLWILDQDSASKLK